MRIYTRLKGRKGALDIDGRDGGTGTESGMVLPLDQVGTGVYNVAYTLPVTMGTTNQQLSLQVDTGSSDLWIASTSCGTPSCIQTDGHLYDPSAAIATGATLTIPYLSGSASGPIVWDSVSIGGYTIDHQALAAVNDVETELLAPNFSGILGLALPLNSIIASQISPIANNSFNGATWASNLFSANTAPSSSFLSLALSRPGSDQVQSVLGIGQHPIALVPDPSLIRYSTPVSDTRGALFWKATVRAITVYVNGVANQVKLGTSNTGAAFPNAVLDSGTALIFTTTTIANAIYGSIGIHPASDGMYYVPCTTPLNMSITLDNRSETPLHPLDLTGEPPQENQAQFCTGLIQTADAQLSSPSSKADIILGVPFLRNVYTVMAYSAPSSNGSFTSVNGDQTGGGLSQTITPMLGLLSLTNPTKALQEFHNVRVLNQPMDGGSTTNNNNSPSMVSVGGKKMSVGIVVLIGLLSFLGLCGILFCIRWFLLRRQHGKTTVSESEADDPGMEDLVAYMLTRTSRSRREKAAGSENHEAFSEDELRTIRFEAYMRKEKKISTMGSDRTRVGDYEGAKYGRVYDDPEGREFGLMNPSRGAPADQDLEWDPATALDWSGNTLTQHPPREYEIPTRSPSGTRISMSKPPEPDPAHLRSELQELTTSHRRNSSLVMQPLLASQSQRENEFDIDDNENNPRRVS